MTALIFGACQEESWDFLRRACPTPELVIAADGGIRAARAAGYEPDLLIGDWDSGGKPQGDIPSITFPPEKDLTDLEAAAREAIDRGCRRICFTACLGGRLDLSLSNLGLLELLAQQGVEGRVLGEGNEVFFWDGRPTQLPRDPSYRFLSILPLDRTMTGVCLEGVKYPLTEGTLHRGRSLSVSNEITAPTAHISARSGCGFVIRSRKFQFF